MELCILSGEVMADIKAAAWLESELHPELNRHRRHEMADICEADNVERVWRVLGIAVAEVKIAIMRILVPGKFVVPVNVLRSPDVWRFRFLFPVHKTVVVFLREKIHEYLVASVMADRCATLIPEAAPVWRCRMEAALATLRTVTATLRPSPVPVRRPLWPL